MKFSPVVLPDLRSGYVDVLESVIENGRKREARGYVAYDVADASFTILDTARAMPVGVRPGVKQEIGYAEALLLCAGVESPSLLSEVSDAFRRFMDGGALAGSYGPLVRPQMEHVVETLRDDRDSRQAVVQVHPGIQNVRGIRDVPCTINLGFELRDDGLHMRATMRSNDVWLGLTYDAFMFCQLGWTVGNVLGVPLCSYTHHAYSLHLYDRNLAQALEVERPDGYPGFPEPMGFGSGHGAPYFEWNRERAELIYQREDVPMITDSEEMYRRTLAPFRRQTRTDNFSS